jgi:hypothetical protein
MKKMYRLFLCIYLLMISATVFAQAGMDEDEKVQMAEGMRASGKIYVVVAVLLVILAGLFIYLIQLDKKLKKLEKENT